MDLWTLAEDRLDTGVFLVSISIALPMAKLGYISIVQESPHGVPEVRVEKRFDKYNRMGYKGIINRKTKGKLKCQNQLIY